MTERQTLENVAAIRCREAAQALRNVAWALAELGTADAILHATEAAGASQLADEWARDLERQHRAKQLAPGDGK